MNYTYASGRPNTYSHRHHHRSSRPGPSKSKRRFLGLFLNLCLLVGGSALFGTAIHYYFLGQDREAEITPSSIEQVRSNYGKTILYSFLGAIPLTLGILGEAKRMRLRHRMTRGQGKFPH
jgi:hypothetical protein